MSRTGLILCLHCLIWSFIDSSEIETTSEVSQEKADLVLRAEDLRAKIVTADKNLMNHPTDALRVLEDMLSKATSQGFESEKALAYSGIGKANYILGNYYSSLEAYLSSLSIRQDLEDEMGIAMCYNSIGLIYTVQNRFTTAIETHKKSLELCRDSSYQRIRYLNHFNISVNLDAMEAYDEALQSVDLALSLVDPVTSFSDYSMTVNRKANILCNKGKHQEAMLLFNSLLDYGDALAAWEQCFAFSGLAICYEHLNELETSAEYAIRSLEIATEIESKWDMSRALKVLSSVYAKLGEFENAHKHQVQLAKIESDMFTKYKESEINFLNLQQSRLENARLENLNHIKENKIRNQRRFILLVVVTIVITSGLTLLLCWKHLKIAKLNASLEQRSLQLENQSLKLKSTVLQLEEASESRNKLYSVIAHDLRGPVGILKSLSELAVERQQENDFDEVNHMLKTLQQYSSDVFQSLENLLVWANSARNASIYQPKITRLLDSVEPAFQLLQQQAVSKEVSLSNQIDPATEVFADVMMLETIVRNLINNAIKFTNSEGEIVVKSTISQGNVTLSVADNGIGIEKDKIEKILNSRDYEAAYGTNAEKGIGIGLRITMDFVAINQGKLWIESEVGKGTTVYVSFPSAASSNLQHTASS